VPASERAHELALAAAEAAADKKAQDIVIIDVTDQLVITDAFVLASAPNERQVSAVVEAVEERLKALPEKAKPVRREGERAGRWVLLDYIDIVVHVQHSEEREFYALDRLWKDCPIIPFTDRPLAAAASPHPSGTGEAGGVTR
jgi:ribosome-associated protein